MHYSSARLGMHMAMAAAALAQAGGGLVREIKPLLPAEPKPKPKEPPSPEVLARVRANQERIEADRVAREGHAKVMEERRRLTPRFQAAEAKRARKAARRLELNNV